jgi:hypothetical protein
MVFKSQFIKKNIFCTNKLISHQCDFQHAMNLAVSEQSHHVAAAVAAANNASTIDSSALLYHHQNEHHQQQPISYKIPQVSISFDANYSLIHSLEKRISRQKGISDFASIGYKIESKSISLIGVLNY